MDSDWEEEANIHDARQLYASLRANDDVPVELPLRPRWTAYFAAAALLVVILAVGIRLFLA